MNNKITLLVLVCFLGMIINGCVARTYTIDKQRVDQDLSSGNRGVLFGEPKVSEEGASRKTTRRIDVLEFELPAQAGKAVPSIAAEPAVSEASVSDQVAVESAVVESTQESVVVVGPAETPTLITTQKYTVREGDTLQKISQKFYGTTKRWNEIYKANQRVLKSPDQVYPGQVLQIPVEGISGAK